MARISSCGFEVNFVAVLKYGCRGMSRRVERKAVLIVPSVRDSDRFASFLDAVIHLGGDFPAFGK